jgi:hypothetical protein
MSVWQDKYFSRQLHIYEKKMPNLTHTYCKKAIRVARCRFGGINISPANNNLLVLVGRIINPTKPYMYSLLLENKTTSIYSHLTRNKQ